MTDYKSLGADLDKYAAVLDSVATAARAGLTPISAAQDAFDYLELLDNGDVLGLGETGASKVQAASSQLAVLATLARPTGDYVREAVSIAGQLGSMSKGFAKIASFPRVFGQGMHDFLVANGVPGNAATSSVNHFFTPSFPDSLRRSLFGRPFQIAKAYDDLALEAMRSAAGGRLAQLVAATKVSVGTSNGADVRAHLSDLQVQLLSAMQDPSHLPAARSQTQALLVEAGSLDLSTGGDLDDQVIAGELLREILRTAAATDLCTWTSNWGPPTVPAHTLEDARAQDSLEIDCPPPPTFQVSTPREIVATPPADGSIVRVAGRLGPVSFKETGGRLTSWCDLSDIESAAQALTIVNPYSMLDTSGESVGTVAIVDGRYTADVRATGQPGVLIGVSRFEQTLAPRWKKALDSIYVPRRHGEHIWWSWDVGDNLGAANPLLYAKWWR